MSNAPIFIGYDVRVPPEIVPPWDDDRRRTFLLRHDAPKPLSVDSMVWPHPEGHDFQKLHAVFGLSFLGLTEHPCRSGARDDVGTALSVYPARWSPAQKRHWDELACDANGVTCGLKELELHTVPTPSLDQYAFIGFDVADCGLVSGLSNCGYSTDEPVASYRAKWTDDLNVHHLFDDLEDAHAFAEFANRRIPEHAPFYVFGLWQAE